ncbi:MAG: hypothetical protein FD145_1271 [Candidatus Saganbacteria bacterium]|uniref:Flagellar basal body rod protein FlgB n=1 Tax=Candidatus Saganbacteria bacterium TaxID=2575572 RepID=A0A833L062_UNCSA|nr:MAG: hypothetical protein FD145_1271 [Candidatus Saganbacteria bacterium]
MPSGIVFDPVFGDLEKAMKIAAAKQSVISHNIANANTPGFEKLEFDEELNRAVRSNEKVSIEKEMAALSNNSINYASYVKILSAKLNNLKTIATQGRR